LSAPLKKFLFFASVLLPASLCAHYQDGLIAAFYFSGNCNDNIHGIVGKSYGATLTHDRFGNANAAYCLDGNNDYINLSSNRDIRLPCMTISLWVKANDFKSSMVRYPGIPILATRATSNPQFYEAYSIGIIPGSQKFMGSCHSSIEEEIAVISSANVFPDKWQHVVYMFDHDTIYLYVDGKFQQKNLKGFVSSYLITDSVLVGKVTNYLSGSTDYNYAYLSGCVDDIKFYGRLLSADEIMALHKEPDPKIQGESPASDNREIFMNFWKHFWYWPVSILLLILLIAVFVRVRLQATRRRMLEKSELEQQLLQSEMKALRSQMNPHFIFNAINSIQHYVLTNEKDLANKYLVKFSKLMRNILDLSKEELISVREELETVRLYLEIEALRFNNAFEFSINCDDRILNGEVLLPPLLIQPFVENAIWHGLLLKEGKKVLTIDIKENGGNITISIDDNGIGRMNAMKFRSHEFNRKSLGMEITQSRMQVVKKVHHLDLFYDVIDKVTPTGEAAGTTVIIQLNSQLKG
jgi:hypothetical protein